jgi:hypothetical protein
VIVVYLAKQYERTRFISNYDHAKLNYDSLYRNAKNLSNEEFYRRLILPNQLKSQEKVCKLPELSFTGHDNHAKIKPCNSKGDWGYLKAGRWHFNTSIVSSFISDMVCQYRSVTRKPDSDFKIYYSDYDTLVENQTIAKEVIEVQCVAGELSYNNLHAHIVDKLSQINAENSEFLNSKKSNQEQQQKCQPMNILLLSYDSLSRVSWFKRLPRTSYFITRKVKFDLLYGQNINGDGTPACVIPLLTGKKEGEMPSTLKSDPNGQYVDQVYEFIWHKLHKKGYVSFHQEDWPHVTTFHYRMRGLSNRTSHHYMRTYQMALWKRLNLKLGDFCIGSIKRHKKALSLLSEFIDMYQNRAKNWISIMHFIENTHDGNERAHFIDDDLTDFLEEGFNKGRFNNTAGIINRFFKENYLRIY